MKAKVDMVGHSFPFSMWAASLKHKPLAGQQSQSIYTYNIKACWWLRGWADWAVHWVFLQRNREAVQAHAGIPGWPP
ncbi:hypothetical protein LP417_19085 [Polaromonas sp. P1-6]|nr:hypothetical protein LP417_19085 [Polaromonas sp. P1-6]